MSDERISTADMAAGLRRWTDEDHPDAADRLLELAARIEELEKRATYEETLEAAREYVRDTEALYARIAALEEALRWIADNATNAGLDDGPFRLAAYNTAIDTGITPLGISNAQTDLPK